MMKRLVFVILIFISANIFAQHITTHENFFTEDLFMSSAYVGTPNYAPVRATVMQKYVGIGSASPTNALLSMHTRIGQGYFRQPGGLINRYPALGNVAVGGYLHSYNFGALYVNHLNLTYGYHLPLHYKFNRSVILALSTGYRNVLFNISELTLRNPGDPIFGKDFVSANMFNSDVAALYKSDNLEIGGGVKNMVLSKNQIDNLESEVDSAYYYDGMIDYKKNFYVNARYIIRNKKYWVDLKPTVFVVMNQEKKMEIMGNLELEIDQSFAMGFNIKNRAYLEDSHVTDLVLYGALTWNRFRYQYGYTTNFNELTTYSFGTHYITVGYNIGQKYEKGTLNKLRQPVLFKGIIEKHDAYKNFRPGMN